MSVKTYPMKVEDGHVYAEVTLRDVIEKTDVDELPFLAEFKRLYRENDVLVRVLHEVRDEAVLAYRCLQSDVEHVVDSESHFFDRWWHAECECDRLKRELAELREHGMKVDGKTDALASDIGECYYVPDQQGWTWWDGDDVEHYEEDSASDECYSASCSECGNTMMVGEEGWFDGWDEPVEWTEEDGSEHKGYVLGPRFKFCPECGRRVLSDAPGCGHEGPGGVQARVQTADGGALEPPMPTPQLGA